MRLQKAGALFFVSAILAVQSAFADDSYIIIDAMVLPTTEEQPRWIYLRKREKVIGLETGQTIIPISPGDQKGVRALF